jgi:hypothetical protein
MRQHNSLELGAAGKFLERRFKQVGVDGDACPVSRSIGRFEVPTRYVLVPGPVNGLGFWPSTVATRGEIRE